MQQASHRNQPWNAWEALGIAAGTGAFGRRRAHSGAIKTGW